MSEQRRASHDRLRSETGPGHRMLELLGIATFVVLAFLIAGDVYHGLANFGYLRFLPVLALLAYLAADLVSGFVHFLADNFGSADTPIVGPNFIGPFRDHHVDPKGITRNDLVDPNGNNILVSILPMLLVWLAVPIGTTVAGCLFGAFFLFLCLAVFLTNQFHKWAHAKTPSAFAVWLQRKGIILSKEHHDIHHESPYDTYYCITVGVWNPLLDRIRFFERTERVLRRLVPGTDVRLRVEREGGLNE